MFKIHRVDIKAIADYPNICYGPTQYILVNILCMKHVIARLRYIKIPESIAKTTSSREIANEIRNNEAEDSTFIKRIVAGDET